MLQLGKILGTSVVAVYLLSGPLLAGDRPTRTPMPTKVLRAPAQHEKPPTRTPISLDNRTRKPTKAVPATRTPLSVEERTRKPTKTTIPTRTPIVVEERPGKPTKTARPTRTLKIVEQPTRTLKVPEERTQKPERPTRTPMIGEERPQKPTKTPRATRTPMTAEERTQKPAKTPRPTRTAIVKEHPPQKPSKTPRATRTAQTLEERTQKPEKTPRATRTPIVKEHAPEKPTKTPRATRTAIPPEQRTQKPAKAPRPTRTEIIKEHAPTKEPRPTRTDAPTKTATPVPQFNVANVTMSCSAVLKKNVTVILKVSNRSGAEIFNVTAGSLNVTRAPGTSFDLGSAPTSFTRLASDGTAIFKWRGSFVSDAGACGFSVSATARGPNGESINLPETDCGTIVLGHGLGESDFVDSTPCGTGGGEGGAAGCGDSGPGPGPASTGLPDLTIDSGVIGSSAVIETLEFPPGDCARVEQCVGPVGLPGRPNARKVLRFSTVTPNIGTGDVYLGNPRTGGNFVYSSCHAHYHFMGYANYRLLSGSSVVATGHKQAFCLIDLEPVRDGTDGPKYTCDNQGITAGWADVYDRYLDCQWVDVTGVPPGTYTLEVAINPGGAIRESNMGNNVGRATVTIP